MDKSEHPTSTTALRIVASKEEDGPSSTAYKGQYRRWPGVVLLVAIVALASVLITTKARDAYDASVKRAAEFEMYKQSGRRIKDGTTAEGDIISDDGQIGNPKQYDTSSDCALPDYQSKNGRLYAVSSNGTEVPFRVKGVNWFGMETDLAVPFGLWENQMNGTTAYEVAAFLSRNKFNAVRIPISIENVLNNNAPKEGVVNKASNRALNLKNYITTLQSIVQSLAFRRIGVLISMHRLTNTKAGANWFDEALGVSQEDFLKAVSIISKELCGQEYWNVMGLDLKNEPEKAEWGTGTDADFVTGAEKIAKVMHDNCPNWLGFVEGVVDERSMTLDGKEITYYDWWGGGLQDAAKSRPKFKIENKLVWAPHYYTTAVAPQSYFYGDKTTADYSTYEELGDEDLYKRVEGTMHHMFGYLVEENAYALLLGEFAGLYSKDAHPMKTTKRTTDMTIKVMMSKNYAGGFMWSLNPESAYEYNPADTKGSFTEGLMSDDWLTPDKEFLNAFVPMDSMPDLRQLPCFEPTKKSS
ncbi:hypothetical protein Poli38472_011518 [Pythium oligandrum]|uniref:Glycoside hydrolase family 5 domain-containing protein n=1 Tax=Pythium oligandrum TaxID=41045 RepID=A0A8K1CKH7_PYTOL|nr:hypothetical protein Poli38472_011518 [Pythium oligandrum]|eukprot:TMW64638.1 hypothetical protein Poli38472_011518 [Pythium oligandrum]